MNGSVITWCMPRVRDPARIDALIAAATELFIEVGYERTKIHRVADRARLSPGTVYLYAEDKEALFELAVLRSLESPLARDPALPYQKTDGNARKALLTDCLREIVHFPQLWVGAQRRAIGDSREEYYGILLEICRWVRRYRVAILLSDRNRLHWPVLAGEFEQVVWVDLHRRLTGYIDLRIRSGRLLPAGDPAMVARFTLDALVAVLVTGPLSLPADFGQPDDEVIAGLAAASLIGSRDGLPLPPHPG